MYANPRRLVTSGSAAVIQPAAYDSINPPQYPWVADGEPIEYHFHAPECRTQWLIDASFHCKTARSGGCPVTAKLRTSSP